MQRQGLGHQSIRHVLRERSLLSAIPVDAAEEARAAAADLVATAGFHATPERLRSFCSPSPVAQRVIVAMPDPDWRGIRIITSGHLSWITDALRQEWNLSKRALAAILDTIGAVQPTPADRQKLIAVMLDECAAAISLAYAAALATRTPTYGSPPYQPNSRSTKLPTRPHPSRLSTPAIPPTRSSWTPGPTAKPKTPPRQCEPPSGMKSGVISHTPPRRAETPPFPS